MPCRYTRNTKSWSRVSPPTSQSVDDLLVLVLAWSCRLDAGCTCASCTYRYRVSVQCSADHADFIHSNLARMADHVHCTCMVECYLSPWRIGRHTKRNSPALPPWLHAQWQSFFVPTFLLSPLLAGEASVLILSAPARETQAWAWQIRIPLSLSLENSRGRFSLSSCQSRSIQCQIFFCHGRS